MKIITFTARSRPALGTLALEGVGPIRRARIQTRPPSVAGRRIAGISKMLPCLYNLFDYRERPLPSSPGTNCSRALRCRICSSILWIAAAVSSSASSPAYFPGSSKNQPAGPLWSCSAGGRAPVAPRGGPQIRQARAGDWAARWRVGEGLLARACAAPSPSPAGEFRPSAHSCSAPKGSH